jgi:hypothetical protein
MIDVGDNKNSKPVPIFSCLICQHNLRLGRDEIREMMAKNKMESKVKIDDEFKEKNIKTIKNIMNI